MVGFVFFIPRQLAEKKGMSASPRRRSSMAELDATNQVLYRGGWTATPSKRLSKRAQDATDRLHAGLSVLPTSSTSVSASPSITHGRQKNLTSRTAEVDLVDAVADADLIRSLSALHAGASPNAVSNRSDSVGTPTLVLAASLLQNAALVKLLLVSGAKIEATDPSGCTALLHAAKVGSVRTVEALLQHGASVDVVQESEAVRNKRNVGVVGNGGGGGGGKLIMLETTPTPGRQSPPLPMNAAYMSTSQHPRQRAASPNGSAGGRGDLNQSEGVAVKMRGTTALLVAASKGHVEVCELLLEYGSAVNAASLKKTTPLMLASWGGHTETVSLLLAKRGGSPN